jgi:hypothetical protein
MSNLKFRHDVNSYAEAKALFESNDGYEVPLCYNTVLERSGTDYEILHHDTAIWTYHPDGSATIDAAWVSSTTANRLQHYKPQIVERINRREWENRVRRARYIVTLANHPGEFDAWEGGRYRIWPDATVVTA